MVLIKKIGSILLALLFAVGVVSGNPTLVFASGNEQFKDVGTNNSHYENIMYLVNKGILHGYTNADGSMEFHPDVIITRSQTAQLLTKALNLSIPSDVSDILKNFKDVDSSNYYAEAIAATYQAGIFHGSNGNFNDGPLTRQQMATALVQAFHIPSKNCDHKDINLTNVAQTHKANVQILADYGITNQVSNFRPLDPVTRGQFATFLKLSMDVLNNLGNGQKEQYPDGLCSIILDVPTHYYVNDKDFIYFFGITKNNVRKDLSIDATYEVSNPNVISVNRFGAINAISEGTSIIAVKYKDFEKDITITVEKGTNDMLSIYGFHSSWYTYNKKIPYDAMSNMHGFSLSYEEAKDGVVKAINNPGKEIAIKNVTFTMSTDTGMIKMKVYSSDVSSN